MKTDYKKLTANFKPTAGEFPLPEGTWLPISVIAEITKLNQQTLRLWYLNNLIKNIKFKKSPILLKIEDVFEIIKNKE